MEQSGTIHLFAHDHIPINESHRVPCAHNSRVRLLTCARRDTAQTVERGVKRQASLSGEAKFIYHELALELLVARDSPWRTRSD